MSTLTDTQIEEAFGLPPQGVAILVKEPDGSLRFHMFDPTTKTWLHENRGGGR